MPTSHDSHRFRPVVPADAIAAVVARVPTAVPRSGPGWCAAVACLLEASAPKPGNVHPRAAFDDLSFDELAAAAVAIAPIFDRAPQAPLGRTILDAVVASQAVTRSNANLGMILAIAPLAALPAGAAWSAAMPRTLTPHDTADIWTAIGRARPGGMGTSATLDLAGPPPADMLEAMRLAAPRDQIASLWTTGYGNLVEGLCRDLADEFATSAEWREAIVRGFLRQLARATDSLIERKHGPAVAADVSARAADVLAGPHDAWRQRAAAFDRSLREPRRINPGTTADLVATALYILLRSPSHE